MTTENQATGEVTKIDPTLASIQQERDDAAAHLARVKADVEERARVREKRALLGEVLNMKADIEKRFEAVKLQKKLLKGLKLDLSALNDDADLTAEDLKNLLKRGHEAFHVENVGKPAEDLASALPGLILSIVKGRNDALRDLPLRRAS
ncbi:hypothetical protein B1VFA_164 [Rhizobium phage B1VFA]|nr:hypothetical protein B1VFA_164 [Rhizobium phage B1VFA]